MKPLKEFDSIRDQVGILLPYQKKWVEDNSDVKVMEKSRRIGISWTEASDDALIAAQENGDDVWYIGYNKDMALEFINDCANWARHYNLAASEMEEIVVEDEDKDIAAFRIRFASGHRVTALSSRPTNLRGKQGIVVIDEGAFHDDLQKLIKAAIALLMWGGKVRIISTHNGDENEFNELINDIRAGKFQYSLHRVTLDDALREGLYKRICFVLGREWSEAAEEKWRQELINYYGEHADEELFCIPSKGSGIYLSRALVESCMDISIPVLRWTCPKGYAEISEHIRHADALDWCEGYLEPLFKDMDNSLAHYFGEDFGRTGDLTVIMPFQRQQNLSLKSPFVVELRNVPFKQQEQILFYIVDRLPQFRAGAMDARGNGQYLAEVAMQRYGATRILQVMLTNEWYRENMPRYKAAFEDKTISIPKDADILDDHRAVRMEKGVAKVPDTLRSKDKEGKQRHGDAAIAGALGLYAVKEAIAGPIEFETIGVKREFTKMAGYMT